MWREGWVSWAYSIQYYNLLKIFLNLDNTTKDGEVFEIVDSQVQADAESRDSQEMALKTVYKLLRELKLYGN